MCLCSGQVKVLKLARENSHKSNVIIMPLSPILLMANKSFHEGNFVAK